MDRTSRSFGHRRTHAAPGLCLLVGVLVAAWSMPPAAADDAPGAANTVVHVTVNTLKLSVPGLDNIQLPPGIHIPGLEKLKTPQRSLIVSVISPGSAPRDAVATLDVPDALGIGKTLELGIRRPETLAAGESVKKGLSVQLYWGSGDTIPGGQPQEVDLSGAMAQQYLRMSPLGRRALPDSTVASWPAVRQNPNAAPSPVVKEDGSAVGAYSLHTSYAGNANFSLGADQDFMPALELTAPKSMPDLRKPLKVSWNPVPHALGYEVIAVAFKGNPDAPDSTVVMWMSSKNQPFAAGKSIFYPNGDYAQAIRDGMFMRPDATSATVPAGILDGLQGGVVVVEALGPSRTGDGAPGVPAVTVSTTSTATITLTRGRLPFGPGGQE